MRIITGKYKGRNFKMPPGIRPTQDKVRKALFDILRDIEGTAFLELFAGSGAVGLEALSRGAGKVVFVENSPDSLRALRANYSFLDPETAVVLPIDAIKAIIKLALEKRKFDIIFLDPPYHKELSKKALQTLADYDILAPDGFIAVQHFKKDILPETTGELTLFKESAYGDTFLSFYRKKE